MGAQFGAPMVKNLGLGLERWRVLGKLKEPLKLLNNGPEVRTMWESSPKPHQDKPSVLRRLHLAVVVHNRLEPGAACLAMCNRRHADQLTQF